MIHSVTQKLESCTYVRCLLVDYPKAFDTINHSTLFRKILTLPIKAPETRGLETDQGAQHNAMPKYAYNSLIG